MITLYLNVFAIFEHPTDSISLYNELNEYGISVTDLIDSVTAYGCTLITNIERIIYLMMKYGVTRITFSVQNNPSV